MSDELEKTQRKLQKVNDKRARLKKRALDLTAEYERLREEARQHLKSNTL